MQKTLTLWLKRYFSDPEAIGLVMIMLFAILAIKTMGYVLAPVIAGIVIAYMLLGMVRRLEKWHFPHLLAVSVTYICFLSVFFLVCIWLVPLLWEQLANLFSEIPTMVNRGQAFFLVLSERYPDIVNLKEWQQISAQLTAYLANLGKYILSFSLSSIVGIVTVVIYLVLVPLLVFFFLRDAKTILQWLEQFMPKKRHAMRIIWNDVHSKIGRYISGKVIEVIIIGVVSSIAFILLGLHYAILLGFLVGLSVVIPYIGFVVITVPLVIVGLIQWGWNEQFFYLMLAYVVISIVDANILVPLLFAEAMKLHPLAIILAVLIFGGLGGFWGVFFAIPLMTLVNAIIKAWPKTDNEKYGSRGL